MADHNYFAIASSVSHFEPQRGYAAIASSVAFGAMVIGNPVIPPPPPPEPVLIGVAGHAVAVNTTGGRVTVIFPPE